MADSSSRKKDYSQQVRKKLASSSRTGQACDRCKLRKIRCDADPNGCAGCRAASEPCATTDRITKKAFRRGHTDQLEVENANLKAKIHDLQQRLMVLGVTLSPDVHGQDSTSGEEFRHSGEGRHVGGAHVDNDRRGSYASSTDGSVWQKHMSNISGSAYSNPAFSMLRGTKLSLFGMQIDLAEFAEDYADMESPQTFSGFIYHASTSNISHLQAPPLPPTLKQAREYAHWFFMFLNTYTPILDKRETDDLLVEVYNDPRPGPRPGRTAAQEVMVHMMFSYIKYQYGQRNQIQQMIDEAMAHFKYSVAFVQDMLRARTFKDIQAMALLVLQLRGLRRPGACWIFGQLTVNLAVEIGLHRSAESLSPAERQQLRSTDIEARKRVFWSLYGLVSNNSTRLGRTPPLRLTDIDIEFPLPVHDFLEHEESTLSEFQKCSFHVGITIAKLLALFSDLHCTFYTITKPLAGDYARLVTKFRRDLDLWRADVPPEIAEFATAENELTMYAMYLDLFEAEFRFLLYHPLLHPPNQPLSYQRTMALCEEAIGDARTLLLKIRDLKSLDVPWHTTTVLMAMTFTQLFMGDQQSEELTEAGYHKLESDMDTWLDLFGTVGEMLGSGARLQTAVGQIIKNVLEKLKLDVDGKAIPGTTGGGHHQKGYAMRIVPEVKTEGHGAYVTSVMQDLTPAQSYSSSTGQATFASYAEAQSLYSAAHVSYATTAYASAAQPAKQLPGPPLGSSMGYTTSGTMGYYHGQAQDGVASRPPTTTPATDWMRWSQANLNPFAHHSQPSYMAPSAATTHMSLNDRSSTAASGGQQGEHHQQWPLNYYNGGQYAASHPG